jgi:hypothetical protein
VELKLGDDFNQSLEGVTFPASLRVLTIGVGSRNNTLADLLLQFGPLGADMYYERLLKGAAFPAGMLLVMPGKSIQY